MPAPGATRLAGSHVCSTTAAQQLPGGTPTPDPSGTPLCVEGDPLSTTPRVGMLPPLSWMDHQDHHSGFPDVTLLVFPVKPPGLLLPAGKAVLGQLQWQGAGHEQEQEETAMSHFLRCSQKPLAGWQAIPCILCKHLLSQTSPQKGRSSPSSSPHSRSC